MENKKLEWVCKNIGIMLLCIVLAVCVFFVPKTVIGNAEQADSKQVTVYAEKYVDIDESDETLHTSKTVAEFIKNNFYEFIEHYNNEKDEEEEFCYASGIESEAIVYLTLKNEYAYYLDFDTDNGYLVVDGNYALQAFKTSGDLVYLKDKEYSFYNPIDGFMYYDFEEHTYCPYETHSDQELSGSAEGQPSSANGEGMIYDIDAYVSQKYSKYSLQSKQIIPNYKWFYQTDTSVYHIDKGDNSYRSEENCVINATYSMMYNWKSHGHFTNLTSDTVDFRKDTLKADSQYEKYGTGTFDNWKPNFEYRLKEMPKLYLDLRQEAINKGYLPDSGMNAKYIPDMVNVVGQKYGYNFNMSSSSAHNSIVTSVNAHRSCVLTVVKSASYGNHAMGLYGFLVYYYKSGWWIFSSDNYAYFYLIDDGYPYKKTRTQFQTKVIDGVSYNLCYYDANKSNSKTFYYLSSY